MHDLATTRRINKEAWSSAQRGPAIFDGGSDVTPLFKDMPKRRIISIDVETGEWIVPVALTSEEGARVAASVLPGMTTEMVQEIYNNWLSE